MQNEMMEALYGIDKRNSGFFLRIPDFTKAKINRLPKSLTRIQNDRILLATDRVLEVRRLHPRYSHSQITFKRLFRGAHGRFLISPSDLSAGVLLLDMQEVSRYSPATRKQALVNSLKDRYVRFSDSF